MLLVENGTQPMQAAAIAVLSHLAASGYSSKLLIAFTHFDMLTADNLRGVKAKRDHVRMSAENALTTIGDRLGPFAERALRKRVDGACFFLASVDRELSGNAQGERTKEQLRSMLSAVETIVERRHELVARPVYDRMNLVLAVRAAAEGFHSLWWERLGLESGPQKEHWTRIKALTRRLSLNWSDQYLHLRPVAELHKELQSEIFKLVQSPVRWEGVLPTDDDKQLAFDRFAEELTSRLMDLAKRRVRIEPIAVWQEAFSFAGTGSTFKRANLLAERVYDAAAPIPTIAPSPARNKFLHEVIAAVAEAAAAAGVVLE